MLVFSGIGRKRFLSSMASAIAKAKTQAGIPQSKIPKYVSPLLKSRESRESSPVKLSIPYSREIVCKGGQIKDASGNCIWTTPQAPTGDIKSKKELADAERTLKQYKEATIKAEKIKTRGYQVGVTARKAISSIRKFAGYGFYGYGALPWEEGCPEGERVDYTRSRSGTCVPIEENGEGMVSSEEDSTYQEEPQGFSIETAKANIVQMKQDIRTIQNAIIEGKKAIMEGKKQIEDGKRQIATI